MRVLVLSLFVGVALAAPQGYNYQLNPGANHNAGFPFEQLQRFANQQGHSELSIGQANGNNGSPLQLGQQLSSYEQHQQVQQPQQQVLTTEHLQPPALPQPQLQLQPQPQLAPQPQPQPLPQLAPQPQPQLLPQLAPQPQPQPLPQLAPQPQPQLLPQLAPQPQPQPLPQLAPQPQPQLLPQLAPPLQRQPLPQLAPQPQPQPLPQLAPQPQPQLLPQLAPQPQPQPLPQLAPQPQPQPLPQLAPQPQPQLLPQLSPQLPPQPQPHFQPTNAHINVPAPAKYKKEFYYLSAPRENFELPHDFQDQLKSFKKNLRVIFVKAPEHTGIENAALQLVKQSRQSNTVVYVLTKQHNAADLAKKLDQLRVTAPQKPEVVFVKYRTPEEAELAQRTIQSQYESLDGPNYFNYEGSVPTHNFIGSTEAKGPKKVATNEAVASPLDYLPPAE
ncbi:uncharacterized protein LOC129238360 [Anastrepha obliqua]|uniref:uncharacterized protein LOC129238360 n=1 Tax=Anastrepha obliqua TaxID=95512 RepID=UPI0024098276|nr:uncharacterized protein LOC129238360 [Anastrepha obliqua]